MRRLLLILLFTASFPVFLYAQTVDRALWTTVSNTTKLSDKWGMQFDMQLKSNNEYKFLKGILIRANLLYYFNKSNSVGLGYVLSDFYSHTTAPNITENRINEQFIHTQNIKAISISQRFRLEQRFIERPGTSDLFSQRFRYNLKTMIPLAKQKTSFKNGMYSVIQDEVYLNLQNKNQLNGSLFDQNRISAGIGYRFSSKFDIEADYMNQFVKRAASNLSNNVMQLNFYTRF